MRAGMAAALAIAAMGLAACGPKVDEAVGASGAATMDEFCAAPGLPKALRHTTLIVDSGAITPASPEEFRIKNPELLKLVLGLADPTTALQSGATAPRERVTILAGSARSATLTPIFSGCIPGASDAEVAQAKAQGEGAAQTYFGSDLASKVRTQQAAFSRQVLLSLMGLNKLAEAAPAASESGFAASPFVKLLKPLGPPTAEDVGARRIFLFTDLPRSPPGTFADVSQARQAGFKTASETGLQLRQAEFFIVTPGTPADEVSEQFLRTFLLGSQADLQRAGGFSANGLSAAPTRLITYRGTLAVTPDYKMPMTMQLASGPDGQLVNSWLTYTASFGPRATPIQGELKCTAERECIVRSDPAGGLGQLWRLKPGAEPEVREDAPLGGLRFLEGTETERGMTGRIHDPVISIGRPGGGLTFQLERTMGQAR